MPAYPTMSLAAVAVVVGIELLWLPTGIFRLVSYWVAMAIVFAFQVPIDGWMTKLSDPIVIYRPDVLSGLRFPLDIPTEEFAYAFAMVTLAIILWERAGPTRGGEAEAARSRPERAQQ